MGDRKGIVPSSYLEVRGLNRFVIVIQQTLICTTWPSFPFTCRLLFIISTRKLVVSRNFLSIRIFWTVFICSFSILINSQLESDVCRLPYTWSLNSLIWWTAAKSSAKTLALIDLLTHFWVPASRFYCWQTSSGISQHIYCVFSLLRPLSRIAAIWKYISCSKISTNANWNVSEYHASCTRVFYEL